MGLSLSRIRFALLALALTIGIAWAGEGGNPEFDGYCANGLANGGEMKTTCDVVWISPEDKLYCFLNEQAKSEFLKDVSRNLRKARAFWEDPAYWQRLKAEEAS